MAAIQSNMATREKLLHLVSEQIGLEDGVETQSDLSMIVDLLVEAFDQIESSKEHSHSIS